MIHPHGIIPAVPAIFNDADQLMTEEVAEVIAFLGSAGCGGIALNLIGGEFYKLSDQERVEMIRTGVEAASGRMLVYTGISYPGTTEACRMAKMAEDLGVDCLIVMPPYYSPTGPYSTRSIIDHFSSIAESTNLPVVIQDFNYGIPLEIFARLRREFSNFAGLKIEGSRAAQIEKRIRDLRSETDSEFSILGGMLGANLQNEIDSGSSGSIPGSSLADFIVMEYNSAGKDKNRSQAHGEMLENILKMEARKLKYFVYIEKAILKHRGIIEHTVCRKPYDYPSIRLMDRILADVDRLLSC